MLLIVHGLRKIVKNGNVFPEKKSISYFHHYGDATLNIERSLVNWILLIVSLPNKNINCLFYLQTYKLSISILQYTLQFIT